MSGEGLGMRTGFRMRILCVPRATGSDKRVSSAVLLLLSSSLSSESECKEERVVLANVIVERHVDRPSDVMESHQSSYWVERRMEESLEL